MNLLLNSHAFLWPFASPAYLSAPAREAILELRNRIYVSVASIWELSIGTASGKLNANVVLAGDVNRDCMLAAQSQALNFPIISADPIFDRYGVQRIW
jgi:PIN domain nuclease of toxin-antitoxin system